MKLFRTFILMGSLFWHLTADSRILPYPLVPNDAGITALVSPSVSGCYSNSVAVVVTIQNFGTNNLNSIPVNVYVGGTIPQTITGTFSGLLNSGSSTNFTVGSVDMSLGGLYNFSCSTALIGDGNINNDSFNASRNVSPIVSIGGTSVACSGNSVILNGIGASTYTWSVGGSGSTVAVTPTITTSYSVIGTNTAGCTSVAYYTVIVQSPTISTTSGFACASPSSGTLTATSFTPSLVSWYASPSSTVVLGTGNDFPVTETVTTTYYAEALSISPSTLFTHLNGGNSAPGTMFNVTASSNLTLSGVDLHMSGAGVSTVQVWYRPGSFVGFETSSSGWSLALTATISAMGVGVLSSVSPSFNIPVASGQTVGVYVTSTGGPGLSYSNGTGLGNLLTADLNLSIYEGKGGNYFNVTSTPRAYNGRLRYYKPGCSSPRVPATFSIVPGFSITAVANNSAVCSGSGIAITANGASSYTWAPSENIGPSPNATVIIASPTVSTIYTVTGSVPSCSMQPTFTVSIGIFPIPTLNITPPFATLPGSLVSISGSGAFTYSWQPGGSNNNIIYVTPSVTTVYTLTGANQYGCVSVVTTTIFMSAIGMDEYQAGKVLSVYPNPSTGKMIIESAEGKSMNMLISDQAGKAVLVEELRSAKNELDLDKLAPGMYFYRITSPEDGTLFSKGKILKY